MLERSGKQQYVTISTSTDNTFADLVTNTHPFDHIVFPDDPDRFIRIPISLKHDTIGQSSAIHYSLENIGIQVSTGPVVDFRMKVYLRIIPEPGTIPLLYPGHFEVQHTVWPKPGLRKPNAILRNATTEKWFYPNGFYCVVHRFSSKEEKRRIVASVVQPDTFGSAEVLDFREPPLLTRSAEAKMEKFYF